MVVAGSGGVTEEGGARDELELNSPLSPPSWLTANADHNRSSRRACSDWIALMMQGLTLDDPPPDHTLLLPPELLVLIAELIPVPPTLASHLTRGILQHTFETQKLGTAEPSPRLARPVSVPSSGASDLGAMRLVCRRWEQAARPVLFSRAKVKRVEEIEFWLGEGVKRGGRRITSCVQ